jgi:hypothetical protein
MYTPLSNLTDEEFVRWLELNPVDPCKYEVIERVRQMTREPDEEAFSRGYDEGEADARSDFPRECPECGYDLDAVRR